MDTAEIRKIPISKLRPHPGNVRGSLGDVTELAEDIKARGILQNLTVVRDAPEGGRGRPKESYTVVIGHRRLEAAKLAGLDALPCAVAEMGEEEQLVAMWRENSHRENLTPPDEARFVQTMMDGFGYTVKEIARKTGTGETKIKERSRLASLGIGNVEEAYNRGASIEEMLKVTKLKDADAREKVLAAAGTNNFGYELQVAAMAQKRSERKAEVIAALSVFATEVDSTAGYSFVRSYSYSFSGDIEPPEDAGESSYYYKINSYDIDLLGDLAPDECGEMDGEDPEEVEVVRRRGELQAASETAYSLRLGFVKGIPAKEIRENLGSAAALLVSAVSYRDGFIAALLGVEKDELHGFAMENPERAMLAAAYALYGDSSNKTYNCWNTKHSKNESLDRLYSLLGGLGYVMSDAERSLQDGTHGAFAKDEGGGHGDG